MNPRTISPTLISIMRFAVPSAINTSDLHWQHLMTAFGLDKICHDRLASFEVGAMKPAPEIFAAACGRFDLRPETTIFIDDLDANVQGAIACGWQGFWHRDVVETKAHLNRLVFTD
ncbi:MAG: HAD-IA family hydrolase [Gammaproteobacteria bacterium]|nr:HAD-IA family hydrolase [Gammaproteobacteria bacterium]